MRKYGGIGMNTEEILRLKVRLLTEGASISDSEFQGRKGGAGPVGGRYFLLPNGRPVGIPIRSGEMAEKFKSAQLEPTEDPMIWLYDRSIELELVPKPSFYDLKTDDGIPYNKIALLHGRETLATTLYQNCRYWLTGQQCKFCTIPHSYQSKDALLEKTPEQFVEVLQAALNEGVVKDILMTTGTPDADDVGIERILSVVRAIREISDIPVGVQFEPPIDAEKIHEVYKVGVNAVGIHIESIDPDIRAKYCPGKTEYGSYELYMKSWKLALDLFGKGNVSTFILYGLGEDLSLTLSKLNEIASTGVLPVITPIRPAPNSQLGNFIPSYLKKPKLYFEFVKDVGRILFREKINPKETTAGCHRCGGCTPIQEAYDFAQSVL
ncbi:MAG: radical SAM protein [Candidatus Lokiarchaeota archaeon]|nr:radical SAM protein [Candidatus Lokiarchaeota archaeon]